MFACKWCEKEYDTYTSIGKHCGRTHGIDKRTLRLAYFHNGIPPVCNCGCGEETKLHNSGFMEYVTGHNSRVANPMEGVKHSDETRAKMSKVVSENFAKGSRTTWSKGKSILTDARLQSAAKKLSEDKERARKISEYHSGRPKSKEHAKKIQARMATYWANPLHRAEQRMRSALTIQRRTHGQPTQLELDFCAMLDEMGIDYKFQYMVEYKVFDVHIPVCNGLIEVDGDFYHGNPTLWPIPQHPVQVHVMANDLVKNEIAERNGFKLLRVWETDIRTRPDWVKEQVSNFLQSGK